jgi:hypothetical protein
MSEAVLEVMQGGKSAALDRVVADAKKMEEHEEVDRWQFSDDVLEAVEDISRPETVSGLHKGNRHEDSGFYQAIDEVNGHIKKAGVISVGRDSIVGAYKTAQAWPQDTRVENATYWAHYELRGKEYEQSRQRALRRLVAGQGRVGPKDVRLWKSSRKPTVVTPFLTQIENRVRAALKRGVVWNQLADGDRAEIVRILYALAGEVERETFGR